MIIYLVLDLIGVFANPRTHPARNAFAMRYTNSALVRSEQLTINHRLQGTTRMGLRVYILNFL